MDSGSPKTKKNAFTDNERLMISGCKERERGGTESEAERVVLSEIPTFPRWRNRWIYLTKLNPNKRGGGREGRTPRILYICVGTESSGLRRNLLLVEEGERSEQKGDARAHVHVGLLCGDENGGSQLLLPGRSFLNTDIHEWPWSTPSAEYIYIIINFFKIVGPLFPPWSLFF